jgi:hypothetical protein
MVAFDPSGLRDPEIAVVSHAYLDRQLRTELFVISLVQAGVRL